MGSHRERTRKGVDLYQVHWPDAGTPAEETASTLWSFVEVRGARPEGVD